MAPAVAAAAAAAESACQQSGGHGQPSTDVITARTRAATAALCNRASPHLYAYTAAGGDES